MKAMSLLTSILLFASLAHAQEPMKILGAPGAIKALQAKKEMLQKATGRTLEFTVQNPANVLPALKKKLVDGIAVGGDAKDFFATPDAKAANPGPVEDYEWLAFGGTTIMAVLHPENPVQSLTKQQITDLVSGKLKTWETINGRKDPVKVVLNKAQVATTVLVPRFFLGKEEMPNADFVTTTRAVAEKIKLAPGAINFSGSKFEEAGIKLKFIDTDAKIDYVIGAKKPLSPEQTKLFQALKP